MNRKNNIFQLKSLQASLVLSIGLILVIVGGSIIIYSAVTSQNTVVADAKEISLGSANFEASKIDAEIEVAMDAARTLITGLCVSQESVEFRKNDP